MLGAFKASSAKACTGNAIISTTSICSISASKLSYAMLYFTYFNTENRVWVKKADQFKTVLEGDYTLNMFSASLASPKNSNFFHIIS